jgi:hypothetical protein
MFLPVAWVRRFMPGQISIHGLVFFIRIIVAPVYLSRHRQGEGG